MLKLIPLFIVCICLMAVFVRTSIYDYRTERYVAKNKLWFILTAVVIIIFAGLRVNYNDTANYITGYEGLVMEPAWLLGSDWSIGEYPGFVFVSMLMKQIGLSAQSFIMLFSAVCMGIPLWFIWKYSKKLPLSVYLYFTMGCFGFSMAAVKQCTAISFCLVGVDCAIHKKYVRFVLWVLLAALFHPYAVLFLITPLLDFKPWTAKTYVLIAAAGVAGLTLQRWLANALDMAQVFGIEYDMSSISGEGVNVIRLAVLWAPVIMAFFTAPYWKDSLENRKQYLIFNLTTLNAEIMILALFGNPVYFGRLANYFLVFQTISLPWLLQYFNDRSRRFLTGVIVFAYFLYFFYGNVLNGRPFDDSFVSNSLFYYLSHIMA